MYLFSASSLDGLPLELRKRMQIRRRRRSAPVDAVVGVCYRLVLRLTVYVPGDFGGMVILRSLGLRRRRKSYGGSWWDRFRRCRIDLPYLLLRRLFRLDQRKRRCNRFHCFPD